MGALGMKKLTLRVSIASLRRPGGTYRIRVSEGNRVYCEAVRVWVVRRKLREARGYSQTMSWKLPCMILLPSRFQITLATDRSGC